MQEFGQAPNGFYIAVVQLTQVSSFGGIAQYEIPVLVKFFLLFGILGDAFFVLAIEVERLFYEQHIPQIIYFQV